MGNTCSCGSRPCGGPGGGEEGAPAPSEYEPLKGAAAEEDESLRKEDFAREACPVELASTLAETADDALAVDVGRKSILAEQLELAEDDSEAAQFGQAEKTDLAKELRDDLRGALAEIKEEGQETGGEEPGRAEARAQALAGLREALERSPPDASSIARAIEEAKQACVAEQEIDVARKRLEVLTAIGAMNSAVAQRDDQLSDAIAKAVAAGAHESDVASAMQALAEMEKARKHRSEEEQRRLAAEKKAAASTALRLATADKDIGKLQQAIDVGEQDGVPQAELADARKVLIQLEKKAPKGKGGCLPCGGGAKKK